MKINDVEKRLGISKANIRFYEKENLLTPNRSKNGYRDYSEADITRLKEIIILRKLGIPVQQIQDILDGVLPLQEALDTNITLLQSELEKLNGSLALCRQLKAEYAQTLDTERYWDIIQNQEDLGFQFQNLVEDYLKFSEINYEWLFWPLPVESLRSPWKVGSYILALSTLNAVTRMISGGENFIFSFAQGIFNWIRTIAIWTAVFIPLYILSKKRPKLANGIMTALLIAVPIACLAAVILIFASVIPA